MMELFNPLMTYKIHQIIQNLLSKSSPFFLERMCSDEMNGECIKKSLDVGIYKTGQR
jgi:hypothetical protein